jgi:hypothetical protein
MLVADTESGEEVYTIGKWDFVSDGVRMTFSADGTTAAAVAERSRSGIWIWQVAHGRRLLTLQPTSDKGIVIALAPDGKALLTAEVERPDNEQKPSKTRLTLRNVPSGDERWTRTVPGDLPAHLAFSPVGAFFAVADETGVYLFDVETGTQIQSLHEGKEFAASALRFSPDGRTLAGGKSGKVVFWETATGQRRAEFTGHHGEITALAFAPDGQMLASGGEDTTVLLWDLTGKLNAAVQTQGPPLPRDYATLWEELALDDPAKAYRLIQRLTAHPAEATALVKAKLPPAQVKKLTDAEIERCIADLEHDDFQRRERAQRELAQVGKAASAALTKALQSEPSTEKKRRLTELLDALKTRRPRPEMVRPTRALEVLERIGTQEAKQVLEELAKGDPDAKLTQDAKATLKRLSRE